MPARFSKPVKYILCVVNLHNARHVHLINLNICFPWYLVVTEKVLLRYFSLYNGLCFSELLIILFQRVSTPNLLVCFYTHLIIKRIFWPMLVTCLSDNLRTKI